MIDFFFLEQQNSSFGSRKYVGYRRTLRRQRRRKTGIPVGPGQQTGTRPSEDLLHVKRQRW